MNYLEYKNLKNKLDFGTEAEQAVAAAKMKKSSARERWMYQKMYDDEIMGRDPLTSRTSAEPVRKSVEAVKPAVVDKPTKTATRGKDKPKSKPMSYEQFVREFNDLGKSNLYRADGRSPMVRLSELSREHPDVYAAYRDRMREQGD